MKILITGATGLVGKALVKRLLQNGQPVNYLTTSQEKITNSNNYQGFYWNPQQGIIDENCLIGVDAIIHLAGATISKRWTNAYKQEIVESRILSSNLLFRTLKNNPHQVKQIVSASAIGIYQDSLQTLYAETSTEISNDFLARVVVKWENSVDTFKLLGIKVSKLRTGLVLSDDGGALPEMAKPIRLGIGSSFGSGKQWQSWIHLDDLTRMYAFAVEKNLEGTFNAVAPNPVRQSELTKVIAKILRKPLFMPNIPKFLMKLILGEMHVLLFASQNVGSQKITAEGFVFEYITLLPALENILGNKKAQS